MAHTKKKEYLHIKSPHFEGEESKANFNDSVQSYITLELPLLKILQFYLFKRPFRIVINFKKTKTKLKILKLQKLPVKKKDFTKICSRKYNTKIQFEKNQKPQKLSLFQIWFVEKTYK